MAARILLFLLMITAASPALAQAVAQGGVQVPEGSHFTLLALGVLGVIVGRRLSSRKSDRSDPD